MIPGRCSLCRRDVLQVWILDGTDETRCCRCLAEAFEVTRSLTLSELLERLRGEQA